MCVKACTYIYMSSIYVYHFFCILDLDRSKLYINRQVFLNHCHGWKPKTLQPWARNECWNTTHEMNGSMIRLQENHHLRVRFERTNSWWNKKNIWKILVKNRSSVQVVKIKTVWNHQLVKMSVTFWQWCQWRWSDRELMWVAGRKNHRTCRGTGVSLSRLRDRHVGHWHVMPRWSKKAIIVIVLNAKLFFATYQSVRKSFPKYSPALNEKVPVSSPVGGCLTIETDWKRPKIQMCCFLDCTWLPSRVLLS